jgi:hypothetical protein
MATECCLVIQDWMYGNNYMIMAKHQQNVKLLLDFPTFSLYKGTYEVKITQTPDYN